MKSNKPLIIGIGIVVVVVVCATVCWWVNQKQMENNRTDGPESAGRVSEYSDENRGTPIDETTDYKNTALGFQMTFPAGWYLPPADDVDPHAHSCATYICPNGAVEIQKAEYLLEKDFNALVAERKLEDESVTELKNFIAEARVIKGAAPGAAEGWSYEYDIMFYGENKAYLFFTDNDAVESTILSTFKLLK